MLKIKEFIQEYTRLLIIIIIVVIIYNSVFLISDVWIRLSGNFSAVRSRQYDLQFDFLNFLVSVVVWIVWAIFLYRQNNIIDKQVSIASQQNIIAANQLEVQSNPWIIVTCEQNLLERFNIKISNSWSCDLMNVLVYSKKEGFRVNHVWLGRFLKKTFSHTYFPANDWNWKISILIIYQNAFTWKIYAYSDTYDWEVNTQGLWNSAETPLTFLSLEEVYTRINSWEENDIYWIHNYILENL